VESQTQGTVIGEADLRLASRFELGRAYTHACKGKRPLQPVLDEFARRLWAEAESAAEDGGPLTIPPMWRHLGTHSPRPGVVVTH
jgi:hypothetical protein